MNGRTTIARKNGDTRLGNTRGLSRKDIDQAWLLYCKTKATDEPPTLRPTTQSPSGNSTSKDVYVLESYISNTDLIVCLANINKSVHGAIAES